MSFKDERKKIAATVKGKALSEISVADREAIKRQWRDAGQVGGNRRRKQRSGSGNAPSVVDSLQGE